MSQVETVPITNGVVYKIVTRLDNVTYGTIMLYTFDMHRKIMSIIIIYPQANSDNPGRLFFTMGQVLVFPFTFCFSLILFDKKLSKPPTFNLYCWADIPIADYFKQAAIESKNFVWSDTVNLTVRIVWKYDEYWSQECGLSVRRVTNYHQGYKFMLLCFYTS